MEARSNNRGLERAIASTACSVMKAAPVRVPTSAPSLESAPLAPQDHNSYGYGSDAEESDEPDAQRDARLRRYRITVAVISMATLVSIAVIMSKLHAGAIYLELLERLKVHPRQGSWIMIGVIVAGTIVCFSGNFLWLSAGFVVKPYPSAVLVSVTGAAIGASITFAIGRYTFRSWVKDEISSRPKWVIIDGAVQRRGFRVMLALRLALFPYNLGNYLFSASGVRYCDYLAAMIGIMPAIFVFAYIGSLARDIHAISSGDLGGTVENAVVAGVTLSLLVGVLVGIFIWARRIVREELEQDYH